MSKTFTPSTHLPKLTDDELSQLFHMCLDHVDLLIKIMPGHPWLELLKKDPQKALIGLTYMRDKPQI